MKVTRRAHSSEQFATQLQYRLHPTAKFAAFLDTAPQMNGRLFALLMMRNINDTERSLDWGRSTATLAEGECKLTSHHSFD